MKNKRIVITAILLVISIGIAFWVDGDGNMRAVEFLASFAVGVLTGFLILQVASLMKIRQ